MIDILMWVSIISGGLLVFLLLLSMISGLDTDLDFDMDTDTDGDVGGGGIGYFKGALTFLSISSWMAKVIYASGMNVYLVILVSAFSGIIAVLLLSMVIRLLLKAAVNVNWDPEDARFKTAKVYLKIPVRGSGIISVNLKGANRELKARTTDGKEIKTGATVVINDIVDGYAIVSIPAEIGRID